MMFIFYLYSDLFCFVFRCEIPRNEFPHTSTYSYIYNDHPTGKSGKMDEFWPMMSVAGWVYLVQIELARWKLII